MAAGRLHRIHDGVFAVGRPDLSMRGRWTAAVLACGEGALLSHRAAAALHELLRAAGGAIDVTIPNRIGRSRSGLRIHRSTCLTAADRVVVDGIPCTSVARTLLDIARGVSRQALERACHQAEIAGVLDLAVVGDLLERRRGQPGTRRLRAVLSLDDLGSGRTRSALERRFHALSKRSGLPPPAINAWIAIAGEEWQFDFVWHEQRVIVEVDGWGTHRTRWAFQNDRRRDRVLRLHGWEPLRFTWEDVVNDPRHVDQVVSGVLASRS